MAKEVRLPQLGQTMEEGTIVNCLVNIGDEVKKGDIIFEIETDKATLEMESPAAGFVKYVLAKPEPAMPAGRIMASPRAKKLAADLGVDLATVIGTGPAGKITEQDVQKAATAKPAAPSAPAAPAAEAKAGQRIPVNRLQRITAEKMLKSKQEIPCFYLTVKADVTNLVELRTRLNETGDVKLSYNDFLLKAVATGLEKYPIMTGQLAGEEIRLAEAIGIGLAISVPDGLGAPIVKDVNKKDVRQIALASQALIG